MSIRWTCNTCRRDTQDGLLWINVHDAHRVADARRHWRETHGTTYTADELLTFPEAAQWRFSCRLCLPCEERAGEYAIDQHRISTHQQMLWWTAHLMGKDWLAHTNWGRIIRHTIDHKEQP